MAVPSRLALQRMSRQRAPMIQYRGYADQPAKSGGGGTPLIILIGAGAIAGGIYYSTRPAPGPTYGEQASQHTSNASSALSNAGSEVNTAAKEVYNVASARGNQGWEKVSHEVNKGQGKVEGAWNDARDKTSSAWGSAKEEAGGFWDKATGKGEEWKGRAEKKGKEVDGEVRGWFSWGKSKTNEAIDKARDDVIWAQREAAAKAREGADKVKNKVEKYQ